MTRDAIAYEADYRDDMLSLSPGRWLVLRVQAEHLAVKLAKQLEQARTEQRVLTELLETYWSLDDLRAIGRGEGVS